jgi:lipopolysaccharide transport system ATP-binding protein
MSSRGELAIRAEGLSKSYRVRGTQTRANYRTLQEEIVGLPRRLGRALRGGAGAAERFWALDDVSFEVNQGEVLGIIGRNGAGKSTLLKVLSRITEPTRGYAELYGRVGTLLEVGTGFHPELTGRENVYLSGAILGMRRREIARRFDEIISFAEVERFVDTPVKHYSSGMYMRLAFAVAAHLDAEILVIDEVLAVGDAGFQTRCLGKMGQAAHAGRTVLFVSHNLDAVRALCSRAFLLSRGQVASAGSAEDVTRAYESAARPPAIGEAGGQIYRVPTHLADAPFRIDSVEAVGLDGAPIERLGTWDAVRLRFRYHADSRVRDGSVEFWVCTPGGTPVLRTSTAPDCGVALDLEAGDHYVDCTFPAIPLAAGTYRLVVALARPNVDWLYLDEDGGLLVVDPRDVYGSGLAPSASRALVAADHQWEVGH